MVVRRCVAACSRNFTYLYSLTNPNIPGYRNPLSNENSTANTYPITLPHRYTGGLSCQCSPITYCYTLSSHRHNCPYDHNYASNDYASAHFSSCYRGPGGYL
jgi:hypothetical protein